jgi:hypothetical protein
MKRQRILISVLALGLLLTLVAGLALAQEPVVQEKMSVQGAVGTSFTYQGRVLHDGTPIDGTCDFEFSLWDAPSGGSQLAGQAANGVEVNDGYFSVELDFGDGAFTGDARYLQIGVDCGGGGALLEPRVALAAAPYAHSLRPGAEVEGSGNYVLSVTNTGTGDGIRAFSSAAEYNWAALYGVNDSSGSGVYGSSSSGSGVYGSSSSGVGVYGGVGTASGKSPITGAAVWGDSADRPGVFGTSNSAGGVGGWSTSGPGVSGISDSSTGVSGASNSGNGVEGASTSGNGVHGTSSSGVGVYGGVGTASGKSPITGAGVWGDSADRPGVFGSSNSAGGVGGQSTSGPGVTGISDSGNGVAGTSNSGNGVYGYSPSGHGVHGQANPPDGYGIYSEGNAYVAGELFWDGKTSYIAISTAAFIPELYGDIGHVEYDNEGYYLENEEDTGQYFAAQAQLPHNAIVTELRVGWRDGSDTAGTVYLKRRSMFEVTQAPETMASVTSVGSFGGIQEGVRSDDTIDNAAVDNENYTYYLELYLPSGTEDIKLYGVVIEYTIYEPY